MKTSSYCVYFVSWGGNKLRLANLGRAKNFVSAKIGFFILEQEKIGFFILGTHTGEA